MRAPIRFAVVNLCLFAAVAHGQATQDDDDAQMKRMEAQEKAEQARIEKASQIPNPSAGDRWQDYARAHHWDKSAIDALARDKILFGGREYRQIFEPYAEPEYPQFITSDSVLNGYHVLFEETIRRMEVANADRLSEILQKIWHNLGTVDAHVIGNPASTAAAKHRAQITIAVALSLLDGDAPKLDAGLAPIVAAEVKKVREAAAVDKPAWLGPPNVDVFAIDYSRFTVRGFYTQSPKLARYFQTVAWLQAIPFRMNEDEELLAAYLIGRASAAGEHDTIDAIYDRFDQMLGDPDNPDLKDVTDAAGARPQLDLAGDGLGKLRSSLIQIAQNRGRNSQINDQLRLPGNGPPDLTIRILPARRTPDALFFEREMDHSDRALPSGIDVAAALGSPFARQILHKPAVDFPALFDSTQVGQGSLYCDYLNCLQALLMPEKDAPKVFTSPLWQEKTCQTMLSGWAQLRHTWQLQAKENVAVFGAFIGPPGFVEPVPTFYTRMAALCDRCDELVRLSRIEGRDLSQWSGRAHALIDLIEKTDVGKDGKPTPHILTDQERANCMDMLFLLSDDAYNDGQTQSLRPLLPTLKKWADSFDRGVIPDDARVAKALEAEDTPDLRTRWHLLSSLCLHLDALAQKQLRGVDFDKEETNFIYSYGEKLSQVMLYDSDSFEMARDDAPRIADVYRNPNIGKYLEIAIGRPRSFYILYPYHGGEVLCEGAVMPYYEFPHATPMTDPEWMQMLDSKPAPKPLVPTTQP